METARVTANHLEKILCDTVAAEQRVEILTNIVTQFKEIVTLSKDFKDLETASCYLYELLSSLGLEDDRRAETLQDLFGVLCEMLRIRYADGQGPQPVPEEHDEALDIGSQALIATPPGHASRLNIFANLRDMCWIQHRQTQSEDLYALIPSMEAELELHPIQKPGSKGQHFLCMISGLLLQQYKDFGNPFHLEKGVRYAQSAAAHADATATEHYHLARALWFRYQRNPNQGDLRAAKASCESGMQLEVPDASNRIADLPRLANILEAEYLVRQNGQRLATGMASPPELHQVDVRIAEALHKLEASTDAGSRRDCLAEIANAAGMKIFSSETPLKEDTDLLFDCLEKMQSLWPPGSPELAKILYNFGQLSARLAPSQESPRFHFGRAHDAYKAAAEIKSSSPVDRIRSYRQASVFPMVTKDWNMAAELLKQAVLLMPSISPHSSGMADHEFLLRELDGLSSLATSIQLSSKKNPAEALVLLETGRGIVAGLLTATRMDITGLEALEPDLFAEYRSVRNFLQNRIEVLPFAEIRKKADALLDAPSPRRWTVKAALGTSRVPGLVGHVDVAYNPRPSAQSSAEKFEGNEATGLQARTGFNIPIPESALDAHSITELPGGIKITTLEGRHQLIEISEDPHAQRSFLEDFNPALAASLKNQKALRLAELEGQIRKLPGFDQYNVRFTPDYFCRLATYAGGPIVAFNVSTHSTEAFIVQQSGVTVLSFESLDFEDIMKRTEMAKGPDGLGRNVPEMSSSAYRDRNTGLAELLSWLWQDIIRKVLDHLRLLRSELCSNASELPRVCWVTSSVIGLLPLHAAGTSFGPRSLENTMSHVVSSYVTTFRSLEIAQQKVSRFQAGPEAASMGSYSVTMTTTPGYPDLTQSEEEIAGLRSAFRESSRIPQDNTTPTKRMVLRNLRMCSVVHFSCHGISDLHNPSKSGLLLMQDGSEADQTAASTCLTVEELASTDLSGAKLAYLSACSTADNASASSLMDESLHVAAAFQLIGFPHVVGSLWETQNWASREVAIRFYRYLAEKGGQILDGSRIVEPHEYAVALHNAVWCLRRGRFTFDRSERRRDTFAAKNILIWAPFIYLGC